MLKCIPKISKTTIQMDPNAHGLYISNNFKGALLNTRRFCTARAKNLKIFVMRLWNHLSQMFSRRRMKMLSRHDGFMLYGKLGADFFSTSKLLYPNMKVRLNLIRGRPNFYMVSDNTNVSLRIVDLSL